MHGSNRAKSADVGFRVRRDRGPWLLIGNWIFSGRGLGEERLTRFTVEPELELEKGSGRECESRKGQWTIHSVFFVSLYSRGIKSLASDRKSTRLNSSHANI